MIATWTPFLLGLMPQFGPKLAHSGSFDQTGKTIAPSHESRLVAHEGDAIHKGTSGLEAGCGWCQWPLEDFISAVCDWRCAMISSCDLFVSTCFYATRHEKANKHRWEKAACPTHWLQGTYRWHEFSRWRTKWTTRQRPICPTWSPSTLKLCFV